MAHLCLQHYGRRLVVRLQLNYVRVSGLAARAAALDDLFRGFTVLHFSGGLISKFVINRSLFSTRRLTVKLVTYPEVHRAPRSNRSASARARWSI